MTTTPASPAQLSPLERPEWLTHDVWPFSTGSILLDGHRVAVTDTGGEGPVLLFCHIGMWSLVWRDVIADLAADHRCVSFDTPGVGLSARIPRADQTVGTAARAVGRIIDALDLRDIVLVVHDLGGLAALAAVNTRVERVDRLVVVNAFGWRPRGVLLPVALRIFGSAPVRELSAVTGGLPRASSTRFGIGRHLPRPTRRAWRAGMADRAARRVPHRLFADAARNHTIHDEAEDALDALHDRALLTVFGQFGDYLGFGRQWRNRRPDLTEATIERGLHFPMCDDPNRFSTIVREWLPGTG